jgi:hypothetical protein
MSLEVAEMSSISRSTISVRQDLRLIGPGGVTVLLMAGLYYNCQDPYAVTMSIDTGTDEPIDWIFARDLITAALHGPEGMGDVRAWPSAAPAAARTDAGAEEQTLNIALESPDGYAVFETSAAGIEALLDRTYELVPAGQESDWLDLDAELIELLSQE